MGSMEAAVFQGPGGTGRQDVPDPGVEDPGDAIVRVDAVTARLPETFEACARTVRSGVRAPDPSAAA
ncbi:hypothetical protein ACFQ67_13330 [Streptomyces sp. NPDC056488]|uniref:hypothetical protein n=1 Tax=unclassified Streptomyces TaxID=2593676 RepID=UPI003674B135